MWLIKGKLIANNNKRRSADTLRIVPGAFGISYANISNNREYGLRRASFLCGWFRHCIVSQQL